MNFNYQIINENNIIINKWGHYFDFLVEQSGKNLNKNTNFKKHISDFETISKNTVLMYPTIKEILKNLNTIKKYKPIIVLYESQKEEINFLKTYMQIFKLNYSNNLLLEYLNIEFDEDEIRDLSNRNDSYKLIFIFLKCWKKFDLNPSWIQGFMSDNNKYDKFQFLFDLVPEFEILQKAKKIVSKLNIELLVSLLYTELIAKPTKMYNFYNTININDYDNITKNELENYNIDSLMKMGVIYPLDNGCYGVCK